MMFSPESCVVVIVATAILHNISTRDCMPAPEVDEAANDIDGDEGESMARRVIVNRITATTA